MSAPVQPPHKSAAVNGAGALTIAVDLDRLAAAVADELERRGIVSAGSQSSPWLTAEEAAAYLRCSKQALYDRVHQGVIVPARDGRRLLFRRDLLDRYLLGEEAT